MCIRDSSKQYGFDVLVAIFPAFPVTEPYGFRSEHAWVQQTMNSYGFPFVDMLEVMQVCAATVGRSVGADILHPTAEGHHCAGKALADYVLSHKQNNATP